MPVLRNAVGSQSAGTSATGGDGYSRHHSEYWGINPRQPCWAHSRAALIRCAIRFGAFES